MSQVVSIPSGVASPSIVELLALQEAARAERATPQDEIAYANAALALTPRLVEVVRATGLLYFRDDVVGCVAFAREALRDVGLDTDRDYSSAFGA